jgi:hypothetical protein
MAHLELTVAMAGGMKKRGGGRLDINDFLPDFAKPKQKALTPEEKEERLKAALMGMAMKSKN